MTITSKYIIVGLDDGSLHILDHDGGNERIIRASEVAIWTCDAWNDEWVIAGGAAGILGVWNLETL